MSNIDRRHELHSTFAMRPNDGDNTGEPRVRINIMTAVMSLFETRLAHYFVYFLKSNLITVLADSAKKFFNTRHGDLVTVLQRKNKAKSLQHQLETLRQPTLLATSIKQPATS